jgi:probable rRNA maturation factor
MRTVFGADEQSEVEVDVLRWVRLARMVLDQERVPEESEMSVIFVDEQAMSDLHERFLGGSGPTDVLAFPMDEGSVDHGPGESGAEPALLGDIVLCPDVAAKQAAEAGHSTQDELALLTVHGTLHLLGYDHAEPDEEREMFGLQARLLESWRAARKP